MPLPLLEAFAAEMPRLRARDAMALALAISVGSGTHKDPKGVVRDWMDDADLRRPSMPPAVFAAAAAAMGISVVREPKDA